MIDFGKILRRHRPVLSGLGLLILVVMIFWAVNSPALVGTAASKRQLPVYSVERTDKKIAISFDAAWGNEDTQTLIDILDRYGVQTTFFVVGDWVEKYPESVQAISQAGHEVMNHSLHHAHYSTLDAGQIQDDLNACSDRIAAVTGQRPSLFRCPYGEYADHVILAIRELGVTPVQWSVASLDWKGISADEITQRVLSKVEPGSIVLFHNAAEHTPEALPGILETLQKEGYEIVPVSQLLLEGDTWIDNTGKQCPASK